MPGSLSYTRRTLRVVRRSVAVAVSCCALLGIVRLVAPATAGAEGRPPGVERQLTFLRQALDDGAADEAQQLFPEGHFFLHALYGLSRAEAGMRLPEGQTRAASLREARWALEQVESEAGRSPFSPSLVPSYGVFYRGWTNWLRGAVLALQPADARDPAEVRRFDEDSAALGAAFDASPTPFLASCPGQAWPVDSTVARLRAAADR